MSLKGRHRVDPGTTKRGNPRKRRRTGVPGRKALPKRVAARVRQNLKQFVTEEYGTQYELVQAEGISRSTAAGWFGVKSRAPDIQSLWPLIQRGLSLDWLFTDHGYMRRIKVRADADPSEVFPAVVLANLPALPPAKQRQHRRALALMKDLKRHPDDDGVTNFAIQAIQREFARLVELLGGYDMLMQMIDDPYRRDTKIADFLETLVKAAGTEVGSGELEAARQQLEARRSAGRARAITFCLDQLPSGETGPATACFREWLDVASRFAESPDTETTGPNTSPPED